MKKLLNFVLFCILSVGLFGGCANKNSTVDEIPTDDAVRTDTSKGAIIIFEDENLEKAIRFQINKPDGDIFKEDILKLKHLKLTGQNISNISELEKFTNLTTVALSNNNIKDISSLSSLPKLTSISLRSNDIEDIHPLKSLVNLIHLDLSDNKISNIADLDKLSKLRILLLNSNNIKDITPLKNLTFIHKLFLDKNPIESYQPLVDYYDLLTTKDFDVILEPKNPVFFKDSNVEAFIREKINKPTRTLSKSDVSRIEELHLPSNSIHSISGIEHLENLRILILRNNYITDLKPLKNLSMLETLDLRDNNIEDLTPLKNAGRKKILFLGGNPITNYEPIESYYDELEKVDFDLGKEPLDPESMGAIIVFEDENLEKIIRTKIRNYSNDIFQSQVENITELRANCSEIESISGLENLNNLTELFLYENNIQDLEPLRHLTKLRHLNIERNGIKNIEPLSGLYNLDTLYIDMNGIDDFTPVKGYFDNLEWFRYDVINRSLLEEKESKVSKATSNIYYKLVSPYDFRSSWSIDMVTELDSYVLSEKVPFDEIKGFNNLTYINLRYHYTENLNCLSTLTNLKQIVLQNNSLESIAGLKDLPNLEYLDLRYNKITDWEILSEFKSTPEILADISEENQKYFDAYQKRRVKDYEGDSEIIVFKDKNLEDVIRTHIYKLEGDILRGDVKHLFSLNVEGKGIKDLSGMENLTSLSHLYLSNNEVTDLEPLRNITGLVKLELNYNDIYNIDPLENMTELIALELKANKIENIEVIRKMKKLLKLQLEFNEIKDYDLLEEYARRIGEIFYDKVSLEANSMKEKVVFKDKNLENAVRESLHKPEGDILKEDVVYETMLSLNFKNISDISGIENFEYLDTLFLRGNQISNIESLKTLTELEFLDLTNNQNIKDIEPLENLINLDSLRLDENKVSDISSLKKLTKMYSLTLSNNNISNIEPLRGMINLRFMNLSNNNISKIYSLENMNDLEGLDLRSNNIEDITPLKNATFRKGLLLGKNPVRSYKPLEMYYEYIEKVDFDFVKDPTYDEQAKNTIIVFKDANLEKSIRAKVNKPEGDLIREDVRYIRSLVISDQTISDLTGIQELRNLLSLLLYNNNISDIQALAGLEHLSSLTLINNNISDIQALAGLEHLKYLDLKGNSISDIQALAGLEHLNYLNLKDNSIIDISPLSELKKLDKLILKGNPIIDFAPIENHEFYNEEFKNEIINSRDEKDI